jgi:hypothetical protein
MDASRFSERSTLKKVRRTAATAAVEEASTSRPLKALQVYISLLAEVLSRPAEGKTDRVRAKAANEAMMFSSRCLSGQWCAK